MGLCFWEIGSKLKEIFDLGKMSDKNIRTDFADLDGNLNSEVPAGVDLSLLKDASRYGINLDALEDAGSMVPVAEMPKQQNLKKQKKEFWQDLDVRLNDIVNLIMNSSERPIVIVSDDRVVYCNAAAMQVLDIKDIRLAENEPFLSFVDKEDWNLLTSSIGEMLTSAKKQKIRLRSLKGKVVPIEFQAIYLPVTEHFSFILVGGHVNKSTRPFFNNLYDDLTGLPNFFLFEDRVQMAVNNENYKDSRLPNDLIAVAAVTIDNIEAFRRLHLEDFALEKLANTLVLSLKKNYTVARGLKYPFWILMPGLMNNYELDLEMKKLMAIFKEGISDNFTTHDLVVSLGVSVFPNPARSAKKLIEQAIEALKKAQEETGSSLLMFEK